MGRINILLVSAALAAFVLLGSGNHHGARAATHYNLTVTEREYSVGLSRKTVPHGLVTITVDNFGADDHNLYVGNGHGHLYHATNRIPGGQGGMCPQSCITFKVTLPQGHATRSTATCRGIRRLACGTTSR